MFDIRRETIKKEPLPFQKLIDNALWKSIVNCLEFVNIESHEAACRQLRNDPHDF